MRAAFKLWIDQDGKTFGDGPYELLTNVEKLGSLQKACVQMGMSYSKAWKLIRIIEQRLGFLVLDREVGGRFGGGSKITPQVTASLSGAILPLLEPSLLFLLHTNSKSFRTAIPTERAFGMRSRNLLVNILEP